MNYEHLVASHSKVFPTTVRLNMDTPVPLEGD